MACPWDPDVMYESFNVQASIAPFAGHKKNLAALKPSHAYFHATEFVFHQLPR